MTIELSTLKNGLRVVSHRMPHLETVSLGIWVASGSRNESEREHGISHLLEHMAFKGTRRRDARAIAEEIEQVGGELNAATSLEMTAYYARVLKGDVALALDILADILQNSTFTESELAREREVIMQEIAATRDNPDDIVYDLVQSVAYPGQPLGRPILGTIDSVRSFVPDDLRAYLAGHYRAPRMVLSAAGNLEHAALVRHAEALFGGLTGAEGGAAAAARYEGGAKVSRKSFEQSHVIVGFEGPSYRHKDFYAAQVFSALFGGGMSSRLFQEVRERRGLCYAVYSFAWGFADTGLFGVHAATGPELVDKLLEVTGEELRKAAMERAEEREIERAKAQIKAGLLMSLESSGARAEQMARQLLVFGRLFDTGELIGRIEAVAAEDVRTFAERLARGPRMTFAEVGSDARAGRAEHFETALAGA